MEAVTPTASGAAVAPVGGTVLPASNFVAAELLAPWPLLRVITKNGMNAIVATRALPAGSRIAKFYGEVQTTPTMYTLQISEGVHVTCSEGGPTYTNHSCAPNAFFDMSPCTASAPFPLLTALRDIDEGQEISFHYCHTEWAMAVPFSCLCGAPTCIGNIEGFSKLDIHTKQTLRQHLSPFIANKWKQQQAEAQAAHAPAPEPATTATAASPKAEAIPAAAAAASAASPGGAALAAPLAAPSLAASSAPGPRDDAVIEHRLASMGLQPGSYQPPRAIAQLMEVMQRTFPALAPPRAERERERER